MAGRASDDHDNPRGQIDSTDVELQTKDDRLIGHSTI